jgi:poly(3-hydroxybutyrate) depolymerase
MSEPHRRKKPDIWEPKPFTAIPGPVPDGDLHIRTVGVAGLERSYWSPTQQPRGEDVPLLIAVHGLGMTGRHIALGTKLAERAPKAGFHVVFPDALERYWDDHGSGRRDGGDDALFMRALVDHLRRRKEISGEQIVLAGLENGASFVERVARGGVLDCDGLMLVSGSARVASRQRVPEPRQSTAVLMMHGDVRNDRIGFRVHRSLSDTRGHELVPVEAVLADWQQANAAERLPVTDITLTGNGGGWPGGKGKIRSRLQAADPANADATSVLLDFAASRLTTRPAA